MKNYKYDAALSFSGSDRPTASFLASFLEVNGVRVYYDDFEKWKQLGQNLVEHLTEVYERRCRYCIMLISRQYLKGPFPILERRIALDRMILQPGQGYILPIRVDNSWIKGLPRATSFVDLRKASLIEVGELLVRKIAGGLPEEGIHLPVSPELGDSDLRNEEERKRLRGVYDVKRSFEELRRCLLAESVDAIKWVSKSTVDHYGYLSRHALSSGKEELKALHFADRLIALRLRAEVSPKRLAEMDDAATFSWAVSKGAVNKEGVAQCDIRSVILFGEHLASAIVVPNQEKGRATESRFRFIRENERWCLDLPEILRRANLYFESVQEDWDPEVQDAFILEALSKLSGRRISESIWMPPFVEYAVEENAFVQEKEASGSSANNVPSWLPDLQILIRQGGAPGRIEISFEVRASNPSLGINFIEFGPVGLKLDPEAYAQAWREDIKALYLGTVESGIVEHRLAGMGATMFKELLPRDLQQLLWSLQGEISTVQILSDEPYLPWEALKLRVKAKGQWLEGPYLSEAFAVTRWLRGVPEILALPMKDVALVVPKNSCLPSTLEERRGVLLLASPDRMVNEIEARFPSVITAFANGFHDGWHFCGHGKDDGADPNRWGIVLDDNNCLRPEDLNTGANNLEASHPLMFLNACHSGRSGFSLAGVGGWAKQILDLGAGAFIGAHWVVEDEAAKEFALAFYGHFLSGISIAEAVRKARMHLRERFPGDSTWLAYTVFAHPKAVCRMPGAP